ncbi:MAG TPA: hypothetical protein VFO85_05300, partial [Vicinamibacteria bacterium]|nr:hypothetical protein [Vicinamibacteria bacterium]
MPHRFAVLAIAAAVLGTPACDVAAMGPNSRQHVSETRPLDPEGTFTIENTNGAVELEAWAEASVSIEAEKVAPEGTLDDIRIEIDGQGRRVDVRTHHARRGWGGRHGRV